MAVTIKWKIRQGRDPAGFFNVQVASFSVQVSGKRYKRT